MPECPIDPAHDTEHYESGVTRPPCLGCTLVDLTRTARERSMDNTEIAEEIRWIWVDYMKWCGRLLDGKG